MTNIVPGIVLVSLLLVGACSNNLKSNGYAFNQANITSLIVGSTTKEDVLDLLNYPSTTSQLGGDFFYYIALKTNIDKYYDTKIVDQQILAIEFDQDNRIKGIKEYHHNQINNFQPSKNITPTLGDDERLSKKLFGNIGRFNKNSKTKR